MVCTQVRRRVIGFVVGVLCAAGARATTVHAQQGAAISAALLRGIEAQVRDDDGDGVRGGDDQCPREPRGVFEDPARRGCPLADEDGDVVPDRDDACPGVAGVPSTDPRRTGCPPLVVFATSDPIVLLTPVWFSERSHQIARGARPNLERIRRAIDRVPAALRVSVEGHCDVGEPAALALRRAQRVRDFLVARGFDGGRIELVAHGASRPLANPGSAGRAQNRRVEFRLIDRAADAAP